MIEKELKQRLHYIALNEPNSIKAFVAKEALQSKNIPSFFKRLQQDSCISGMISSLNHFEQTHTFFENYYDDIEHLRFKHTQKTLTYLQQPYDLKTLMVWFAVEQTALLLSEELGVTYGLLNQYFY